eukprot:6198901-Pleurochrysis_carterae.AAC.1
MNTSSGFDVLAIPSQTPLAPTQSTLLQPAIPLSALAPALTPARPSSFLFNTLSPSFPAPKPLCPTHENGNTPHRLRRLARLSSLASAISARPFRFISPRSPLDLSAISA